MLALVGSGEYLPTMDPVDCELLRRLPALTRVVCLPTAAGTEGRERIEFWSRLGVEHFTQLGVPVDSIPIIDRESANETKFATLINLSNFVYLSGGKPDYLYATLKDTLAWEAIRSVLSKGGLLAGCSAGAMVQGEKILGWRGGTTNSGFGLLPGTVVIPHYDEIPKAMVAFLRMLMGRQWTIVGIEANTALFQSSDNHFEVLGNGGVTVWKTAGSHRYTSGPVPPWDGWGDGK
jgi:cyanophycinase